MSGRSLDWRQWILPAGLIACVAVMIVPVPAPIIDVLLAGNIALAVIILLTTLQVRSPLDFSLFPSILLGATLGRLVLNISSTRLILSQGSEGVGSAGHVIEAFGSYVAGEHLVIGAIVFAIIIVVQFVVVTKGSTRVSEVAARFSLDGMPGKQMAIDADLSAGLITHEEARQRREAITQQADFFGAMDGASKFVRGDAIAAIIITLINIFGGLLIGLTQNMSLTDALSTFARLTIGEGLACQIPAFLIAASTGVLLTRSTRSENLAASFFEQLFGRTAVLVMAAVFLSLLVLTKLPAIPLLSIAALCCVAGLAQNYRQRNAAPAAQHTANPAVDDAEQRLEDLLRVDLLEIEIGVQLIPLADPRRGGDLLQRISSIRSEVAAELGLIIPKVRIRDNLSLPGTDYRVRVASIEAAAGSLIVDRVMATPLAPGMPEIDGIPVNPFAIQNGVWIEPSRTAQAQQAGYRVDSPTATLAQKLKSAVVRHADSILTRDATRHLIEQVRRTSPAVVDELIPETLKLSDVQQVLQMLLREGISIRRLAMILEALGDCAGRTQSIVLRTEFVRQRLAPAICGKYCGRDGILYAAQLPPSVEDWMASRMRTDASDLAIDFSVSDVSQLNEEIRRAIAPLVANAKQPILLVSQKIRPSIKRLTRANFPDLVVLSHGELTPEIQVQSLPLAAQAA